ncbi:MAG: hypothetical protein Q9190_007072 [Brigantiaea leucoxantha]
MPQLRDVTVHVTDYDGKNLAEWGVQNLRNSNKISAYIKSTTDMPFRVSVRPNIPYPVSEDESSHEKPSCTRDLDGFQASRRTSFRLERQWSSAFMDRRPYGQGDLRHARPDTTLLSPLHQRKGYSRKPPFDFLASLYIDGRPEPERRIIVYLDPDSKDFHRPDGLVRFRCRCVKAVDGSLKEKSWVFKKVGIEAMFDKINLRRNGHADAEKEDEDILVDALRVSDLSNEQIRQPDARGVGQILVELHRVTLGRMYRENGYRARHHEGLKEDVDMNGLSNQVTHTTGSVVVPTELLKLTPIVSLILEP